MLKKPRYEVVDCEIIDNELNCVVDDIIERLNTQDANKNELLKVKHNLEQRVNELTKTNKVLSNELTKNSILKQDRIETCCGIPIFEIPKLKQENERLKQFISCKGCYDVIALSAKREIDFATKELEKVNGILTDTIIEVTQNEYDLNKLSYLEEISAKFGEKIQKLISNLGGIDEDLL